MFLPFFDLQVVALLYKIYIFKSVNKKVRRNNHLSESSNDIYNHLNLTLTMKSLFIIMLGFALNIASAQNAPSGIFKFNSDIGNPRKAGSATYDKTDQSYTLKGAGYNIWFERDEFHFLYNRIKGDFIQPAS